MVNTKSGVFQYIESTKLRRCCKLQLNEMLPFFHVTNLITKINMTYIQAMTTKSTTNINKKMKKIILSKPSST